MLEETPLVKQTEMPVQTQNIYLNEIKACVETSQWVTDFGAKFVSDDIVYLGGFDKAKEELLLIQNLIIAANGTSQIAAEYGAFILKHLQIFNTVKVHEALDIDKQDL